MSFDLLLILIVALVAGTISGIVGFGSSIIMMPILVLVYGPRQAVPIMAIAAFMANISRIMVWWREIDWRACAAYSITGLPAAALGARTMLVLPPRVIEIALGVFFISMIPIRRWMAARNIKITLWHLALVGLVIGYLTGIVVTTGPITTPVFLAYGLVKGGFLATEAAGSLAVYLSKISVFRAYGALPLPVITEGLIVGSALMCGAFIAKRFVLKMDLHQFRLLMELLMLASGLLMLWSAYDSS